MAKRRKEWPRTVEEAVNQLLLSMSDKDKNTVKNTAKKELIMLHHGWGTSIRNKFGLWAGNDELMKSCDAFMADSASEIIIEAVWKRLQEV